MKLGLGTVQFGLDYGVSNTKGKCSLEEVKRILQLASQKGIDTLDTASLYGTSEVVLGECLHPDHRFRIVTKTPKFSKGEITQRDADFLEETFSESLYKLKQSSIYGLMMHDADDLLRVSGDLLFERMRVLKERKLVRKIGVSIYTGEQIDAVLDKYDIDLIQVPINVLDQRLLAGGKLKRLKSRNVEVHARSAFLQGLLLMDIDTMPAHFDDVKPLLRGYHETVRERGLTLLEAALGFVMQIEEIDKVITGVCSDHELNEILRSVTEHGEPGLEYLKFACNKIEIIDPSKWMIRQ